MKKLVIVIGLSVISSPLLRAQTAQPPNGMGELAAYSIFYENYKNEDYESAIRFGSWIYKNMPRTLRGYPKFELDRNLGRLVRAYGEVAETQEEPGLRSAYLDTALIIFDKVFNEFNEDEIDMFEWHFQQGRFFQEHSTFITDGLTKAYQKYEELFEMDPERFAKLGDGYYVQITVQNMVSNGEKDKALEMIEATEQYSTPKVKDYFDQVRNQLFNSPKERIIFLEGKLKENPGDSEVLSELAKLYEGEQMMDKAKNAREKLYDLDPSYENTRALAALAINNASYDMAIQYLKEAMSKTKDKEEQSQVALKISDAYLNKENLQEARKFARQAAGLAPNWGQPDLQIASIYAQAVTQCTSGRKMERKDKVVYWLVLDYLDKARQTDPSVASQVQRQYQAYQPVTPTTEEKFFQGWETGDKMEVDASLMPCYDWINETTTVR